VDGQVMKEIFSRFFSISGCLDSKVSDLVQREQNMSEERPMYGKRRMNN